MSLGIFRTIRGSYAAGYRKEADKIIRLLNDELQSRRLPDFRDSDPDERMRRPLPCGNAGASTFAALQKLAQEAQLSWTLGGLRGARQIALPMDFAETFSIRLGRTLFFATVMQDFASVRTIRDEVIALAPLLKIHLEHGVLSDALSERLNDGKGVADDEPPGLLESERGLWLDLYYATRYCLEDSTPLVIA